MELTAETVLEVARAAIMRYGDATGNKLGASLVVAGLAKVQPYVIAPVDEMNAREAQTNGKGTEL